LLDPVGGSAPAKSATRPISRALSVAQGRRVTSPNRAAATCAASIAAMSVVAAVVSALCH
jgi:hypothetical protein